MLCCLKLRTPNEQLFPKAASSLLKTANQTTKQPTKNMTQSVVIQIGQCGNQVGRQFWERALQEHAEYNRDGVFDESLYTFFRNVDTRFTPARDVPLKRNQQIASLRARAVLIDMEEGVVNEVLSGPLRDVFDTHQSVTSVSGSGNNWAVGYFTYGQSHKEQISDTVRLAVEQCDCLQSFIFLHSMGGGTGSGLGTYVLELLHDEYPSVYRFVTAVYPSKVRTEGGGGKSKVRGRERGRERERSREAESERSRERSREVESERSRERSREREVERERAEGEGHTRANTRKHAQTHTHTCPRAHVSVGGGASIAGACSFVCVLRELIFAG